jgi:hypothetical protein
MPQKIALAGGKCCKVNVKKMSVQEDLIPFDLPGQQLHRLFR